MNGTEEAVACAFLGRPRLVANSEGFLGLEVFRESKDRSIFYLSTRWVSESAFHKWHASDAHHASHRGIPKGLKLDAAFTKLSILEHLCD